MGGSPWFCVSALCNDSELEARKDKPEVGPRLHRRCPVITSCYKEAMRLCRFKAMFGDDASAQPGKLQELMLHETAVSWLRLRLARSVPSRPWLETRAEYEARLKQCCDDINMNLNVDGLCRALNSRIDALLRSEGGRLPQ